MFRVSCFGFRVSNLDFWVLVFGFRDLELGKLQVRFRDPSFGIRVLGFRARNSGTSALSESARKAFEGKGHADLAAAHVLER